MEQDEEARSLGFFGPERGLFDQSMSAVELKQEVRKYIAENEKVEIVRLAEMHGHEVLFTPPYYSNLQPIELAWVYVKGKVRWQYTIGTTLTMVYERLLYAFKELEEDHEAVKVMID